MKPYLEDSPFPLPASAPGQQLLSCKDNGWAEEQIDSLQPDTGERNRCFISFSTWLGLEKDRGGGSGFPRCKETRQELQGKPGQLETQGETPF